jgi:hypothetical protein
MFYSRTTFILTLWDLAGFETGVAIPGNVHRLHALRWISRPNPADMPSEQGTQMIEFLGVEIGSGIPRDSKETMYCRPDKSGKFWT